MKLYGAIYLYDGKIVSLYKGDFKQMKTYGKNHHQIAKHYKNNGIEHIHFVDLNAAQNHKLHHRKELEDIINLGLKVQYAGGVRSQECIDELFKMGVDQVVLGVSAEELIPEALDKYGNEKIVLGLKTKYDKIISDEIEEIDVLDYATEHLTESDIKYVVFKDMFSSGVMIHPNYDMVEKMILLSGKNIIAAGGISEEKHLQILKKNRAYGAIIGKAFYEEKLDMARALRVCIEK